MTKTTGRNFKVGHKVLVLLPTKNFETIGAVERFIWLNPVDSKSGCLKNKETIYHENMLKIWFEREIMAWLNVIFSLANNDVHTKDDVVSDSPPDEVVSQRTLFKGRRGTEVSGRFLWYFYWCSYENPSDKTQKFYGCAYPDKTISDSVCITRSSEARVKTNDRSWYHRGHG